LPPSISLLQQADDLSPLPISRASPFVRKLYNEALAESTLKYTKARFEPTYELKSKSVHDVGELPLNTWLPSCV